MCEISSSCNTLLFKVSFLNIAFTYGIRILTAILHHTGLRNRTGGGYWTIQCNGSEQHFRDCCIPAVPNECQSDKVAVIRGCYKCKFVKNVENMNAFCVYTLYSYTFSSRAYSISK